LKSFSYFITYFSTTTSKRLFGLGESAVQKGVPSMVDFNNELGARARNRIDTEFVIWLTTTDSAGVPQPRPVWFIWDGEAFLVYSQPATKKLEHIVQNPTVSLHFNSGPKGRDVQVFTCTAEILTDPTPTDKLAAYQQKYGTEIQAMGASESDFAGAYRVGLRLKPWRLRGMVPPVGE
jgi:PPOX class probable F420-dependent enzyme